MGSKILSDIQNDLKLLITSLTGFETSDDGYQLCERYVFSNMKHHRFLSTNSHEVKRTITEVQEKFRIYGKYNVARDFQSLVETFLTSFDFKQHPQYDLQWSLLCFLLNLSQDTAKSQIDKALPFSSLEEVDEIDWGVHLKAGNENFFVHYASSSESEWSNDEEEKDPTPPKIPDKPSTARNESSLVAVNMEIVLQDLKNKSIFKSAIDARNWLNSNVENSWWTNIKSHVPRINSNFPDAHICRLYNGEMFGNLKSVGIITEYQACRELLWMFQVPMDMVIFQKKSDNHFHVNKNISISSLTTKSFNSAFTKFCKYFEMIDRINLFEKNTYNVHQDGRLSPLTLEVYYSSISEYYRDVRKKIIAIEQRVMKQNDINTFLTLREELNIYLNRLEDLDYIHRSVIPPETGEVNWRKSYKLLLSIYKEMENSNNRERTNLCASLYLSSLRVYLNIIDTWLSEGRLEDFRNEFIISKVQTDNLRVGESTSNESSPWAIKFLMLENEQTEALDPIMKKLFRKVEDMGRNIELLVTLDRISDLWKINSEQFERKIPFSDDFTNRVLEEVAKFGNADEVDEVNVIVEDYVHEFGQRCTELEDNIKQQVVRINNPFLMKVFQQYIPPSNIDSVDCKPEENSEHLKQSHWGISVFEKLNKISPFILPFRKVLEGVLDDILDKRYSCAAKLVKDILIDEYKLEKHLKLMRSVFMMERGHVMKRFYHIMFRDVERNVSVSNPENLTHLLEEVLSEEWKDTSSHNRWSISLKDACTRQVLQAVDHIVLNYEVHWPINMVLTKEVLNKYNGIFRLGLKLKWALWSLNNLRFADLEGKGSVNTNDDVLNHFHTRRLESLRFWLLHAIGSIHSYLCGQVLQSLGLIFERQLATAHSLDAIIEAHNDYLEKVNQHCLQTSTFSDIMVTINNLLGMCVHVRDRWERGAKQLIASELDLMEASFTKYHTYLALALHNAVQHKEADYLAGLTSAFN